jgi:hypothetical protein
MIKMLFWAFLLAFSAFHAGVSLGAGEPAGSWLVALVACAMASYKDYNRLFVDKEWT